jgi:uncharacterized phiE125 gp8 family phage protein
MTSFNLKTGPASEPISLSELKSHARIDQTDDDELLSGLIVAARQWAERTTARGFIDQTWQLWIDMPLFDTNGCQDGFFEGAIQAALDQAIFLPRSPLLSVSSINVFSEDNSSTIWDQRNYYVDTSHEPGRLVLRSGAAWPTPSRQANGLMVEYRVGYGADASFVPEPIKLAIKQLALHWYSHRGEELMPGTANADISSRYGAINVPLLIQALLNPYRVM